MRIWGVDPKLMCRQHLLGEHAECHSILSILDSRHDELAAEMLRRGYEHNSPVSPSVTIARDIDTKANLSELMNKCDECFMRFMERLAKFVVAMLLGFKLAEEIEREVVC